MTARCYVRRDRGSTDAMPRTKKPRASRGPAEFMLRVRLTDAERKAILSAGDDMSSTVRRALAKLLGDKWPSAPRY